MLHSVGENDSQSSKPCWLLTNPKPCCFLFRGSQLLREEASDPGGL